MYSLGRRYYSGRRDYLLLSPAARAGRGSGCELSSRWNKMPNALIPSNAEFDDLLSGKKLYWRPCAIPRSPCHAVLIDVGKYYSAKFLPSPPGPGRWFLAHRPKYRVFSDVTGVPWPLASGKHGVYRPRSRAAWLPHLFLKM